jgi:hypothetical protein
MEKIGIKAFIHEFTRPIKDHDDDDFGSVKMANYFKVIPCFVKISDSDDDGGFYLEFENNRNLRISETNYYESGVEETMENDSACGFYFKPNDIVKFLTIIFENDTSITYDLQNKISFGNFYRNMKTYIDSGYTSLPTKSSLEKAAELLDNDEFEDI